MDGSQASNLKHNVTFNDLREYIEEVDKLGELRHVEGASWEEDIGMAAELLLHSDCLLYTSPSPRDGLLSRMPSSA